MVLALDCIAFATCSNAMLNVALRALTGTGRKFTVPEDCTALVALAATAVIQHMFSAVNVSGRRFGSVEADSYRLPGRGMPICPDGDCSD